MSICGFVSFPFVFITINVFKKKLYMQNIWGKMEIGRFLLLDIFWIDLHRWNNRFEWIKFFCIWIKLFLKEEKIFFWLLDQVYHQSQVNFMISFKILFIFTERNLFFKSSDFFSLIDFRFFEMIFKYMYTWWCYLIQICFRFNSSNPSFSVQNF